MPLHRKSNITTYAVADSTAFQIGDIVKDDSETNYKAVKKAATKKALNEAYAAYLSSCPYLPSCPSSYTHLMNLTRDRLYRKMLHVEVDPRYRDLGTSQTVEDWVQDVWLNISEAIDRQGITGKYSALVDKAAHNRGIDASKYLTKERKTKASLEKEIDESGDIVDNLEVFRSPIFREKTPTFGLIPSNLTEQELDFLKMLYACEGTNIREAAESLDMPLSTAYTYAKRIAEKRSADEDERKARIAADDAAHREMVEKRIALQKRTVRALVMIDDEEGEVA
jgi:DNA-directed RNA polymerase specialized sigma24 family protein